jgi:hypothetical protein
LNGIVRLESSGAIDLEGPIAEVMKVPERDRAIPDQKSTHINRDQVADSRPS